ncbi:hypothetical protein FZW96_13475 [Bacillus sp. BGMRC 2118]|nr:hypothetical protein FZW96_13475 [Bacillus sp. BGMRC 2118]
MILPKGITGFCEGIQETPNSDEKVFKDLCYAFIQNEGGHIIEVLVPRQGTNFYDAFVKVQDELFHILLNAHFPYLTFASHVSFGGMSFVEKAILGMKFRDYYMVLGPEDLQ